MGAGVVDGGMYVEGGANEPVAQGLHRGTQGLQGFRQPAVVASAIINMAYVHFILGILDYELLPVPRTRRAPLQKGANVSRHIVCASKSGANGNQQLWRSEFAAFSAA